MKSLTIISVLFVGMVWLTRGVTWLWPEISLYLLPIPLAAMLATLLIGAREGMLVAIMTSLAGVLLGFSGGSAVVGDARVVTCWRGRHGLHERPEEPVLRRCVPCHLRCAASGSSTSLSAGLSLQEAAHRGDVGFARVD